MSRTSRQSGWAPGWDEYAAARSRFFARLAADRVLREVARAVQCDLATRSAAEASGCARAAQGDGLATGST